MSLKPVVALDIDGVLGDYHSNFIEFARRYFNNTESDWMRPNHGLPMWEYLGVAEEDYRRAKEAYRRGGWKRWMPVRVGAAGLAEALQVAGAEVWICSKRPLHYSNVYADTQEWLRRSSINYDRLLLSYRGFPSKYHRLAKEAGPRVAGILDDDPVMIRAAQEAFGRMNLFPMLFRHDHNRWWDYPHSAANLGEATEMLLKDVHFWRGWNA